MFSHFFIRRPIFAAVVSIFIVIIGAVALLRLPVARYPNISPPTITVTATYPGASTQTISETVATPIEQEVNGVEGMIYMTSNSSPDGTMELTVTFASGTDLDMANVLVQNRVSLAEPKLPEEVRRLGVTVKKKSPDILMLITLSNSSGSDYDEAFLNNYGKMGIRDELTRVEGVGDVTLFGTGYAMRIWLDPNLMRARDLTTSDVVAAIREQNVQVASGRVGEPPAPVGQAFELTVVTAGRLSDVAQFEDLIVHVDAEGRKVRLGDVASIELGAEAYAFNTKHNGQTTATLAVYQLPGSNAVATADGVVATMERLRANFPPGVEYKVSYDATAVIHASLTEVVVTLFITLGLVVLTVFVFLQDFRATLVPVVTIPVSLVGTFMIMALLGYSLNILTLFGLVLVIGIVVDDAIVVVENTSRLIAAGKSGKEAAMESMVEVGGPVIATTLVLLAVFVPTIMMGGIIGELFRQFAVTISIATVFSSINALTLSPALCALLLRPPSDKVWLPFRIFNSTLESATGTYGRLVALALRLAPLGVVAFVASVVAAVWLFIQVPSGFVPQEDEGYFIVNVQLPDAATMARTTEVTDGITEKLMELPGVVDVVIVNGYSFVDNSRASNKAGGFVVLSPWDDRPTAELQLDSIVRQANSHLSEIQEAFCTAFSPPSLPGVGMAGGFTLQLQDRGGAGMGLLETVAEELSASGNAQSAITGMFTTFKAKTPQLYLEIDREQIKAMGIPLQDVFDTLSAYLGSIYINDFSMLGKIYQVRAQAAAAFRATPGDIERLEIRAPTGDMIPLGTVMTVKESLGPQSIAHFNIYPCARVNGASMPGYSSGQAMKMVEQMAAQTLPQAIGMEWTDLSYQEKQASGAATIIFAFSILMVYLLLAAQYESWSVPMAVVLGVPTALLGAVLAVMWRGFDNNVYTQIGIVLLIGLSAKTAILIVEFAKVQRESGKSLFDATVDASRVRFRAVLMTAFSFILGVIPLLIAQGAGAASRQVLGTVVFGGMAVATVLGVVVVPLLFYVIQSISERLNKKPAA
ncbi:MAG: efflux RND transporter permease subunit [Planctomycetota bacterium]|jgi:HAE1 family hydrophobic/amphiphilic exporter-1